MIVEGQDDLALGGTGVGVADQFSGVPDRRDSRAVDPPATSDEGAEFAIRRRVFDVARVLQLISLARRN